MAKCFWDSIFDQSACKGYIYKTFFNYIRTKFANVHNLHFSWKLWVINHDFGSILVISNVAIVSLLTCHFYRSISFSIICVGLLIIYIGNRISFLLSASFYLFFYFHIKIGKRYLWVLINGPTTSKELIELSLMHIPKKL